MKKRRKSPSVDGFIRFLFQHYNIPTKQDIEKLGKSIDRLEGALKANMASAEKARKAGGVKGAAKGAAKEKQVRRGRAKMTATEKILGIINRSPDGVDIPGLKAKSGFEDKKIRNIIFRLTKQGMITRAGRGVYAAQ
jgi:hypothetical protein